MRKKLLILGSNRITCEIVETAKRMDIHTTCLDWNPLEKAPAKRLSDDHAEISLSDVDAVVKYIKDNNIDGVMTGFTDSYLEYYANICEKANLPCYGNKELFHTFANKHLYKNLLQKFNIPTIEEYSIKDVNNIVYPVLVKPSDNSGGRGITICHNKEELLMGYKKAEDFSLTKNVLIEQYVQGREITVFIYIKDGEVYLTGIGNRLIGVYQNGVIGLPTGYVFPSNITNNYLKTIFPKIKKMLNKIGVQNGMLFMQCLIDGENISRIYDIGFRLTGSLEYILYGNIFDFNTLEEMIKFSLKMDRKKPSQVLFDKWGSYGVNYSICIKDGQIKRISGIEEINKIDGVISVVCNHVENDVIPPASIGTLDQIGVRVFAEAKNQDQIFDIANKIKKYLRIINTANEDMLLPIFSVNNLYLEDLGL